ncbi:ABC transporter substrate-binding protein [Roseovarius aquimarinus]|uniref:ABC transporter substrate-binding protein n=1 Tax=Roseovarius aquimarinus TaxID=1229156 RepID=A0ABW7I2S2_9RHOB
MDQKDHLKLLEARLRRGAIGRRQFMRGALATGIGLTAAGSLADRADAATPKKGGMLTAGLGHGATTDTLDPGRFEAGFLIPLAFGMHGYLTEIDANSAVQPSLAESWEASDGASVWTFTLREGLEFHNGQPVTAEDVIASINYHRGEGSNSAAAPLVSDVAEITAEGPRTVVFKLSGGNADFPAVLSDYHFPILPAVDGGIDWKAGIGTGPYRLDSFKPGVSAELSRFENHWNDQVGHVDQWRLLALLDTNARMTAAASGDVDLVDKVDLKTANLMARKPGVTLHSVAGTQHYTFPMLTNIAPFDDNNVRQALKWAMNREEMVEKVLFGYGAVGNDHPIGPNQRFYNDQMEQKTFDPDKAKFYLDKAGISDLSVPLTTSDAAFPGAVDACLLIQNSAAKCGITVDVERAPNDGYWSDVWQKRPWCASYMAGRPVEDLMFSLAYKSGVSWNESFWSNEAFDALLVAARAELDETKRREMYFEMQEIVANQGGVAIPMFASYVFATADSVGTPEAFASNLDLDGSRFMERWWKAD